MPSLTIDDSFASSNDLRSTQVGRTQESQTEQRAARQRPGAAQDDSVELSALSAELARAVETEPPEVLNRIEQLQEAIATNNFSVPADEVANAVINDALRGDDLEPLAAQDTQAPPSPAAP